ncbi:MAG: potassium-transporting ATPase subunit B, partial [Candidatus Binataceae bacterium]
MSDRKSASIWNPAIVRPALLESCRKLDPRVQFRNPVMFVVEVTALAVTIILIHDIFAGGAKLAGFEFQIVVWLWFT